MSPSEENTLSEQLGQLGIAARTEQLRACLALLDHLEHWSGAFNLTAIHDRREALEKHIDDSLTSCPGWTACKACWMRDPVRVFPPCRLPFSGPGCGYCRLMLRSARYIFRRKCAGLSA